MVKRDPNKEGDGVENWDGPLATDGRHRNSERLVAPAKRKAAAKKQAVANKRLKGGTRLGLKRTSTADGVKVTVLDEPKRKNEPQP